MINEVMVRYEMLKHNLKADQSINLSCFIGNEEIEVHNIQHARMDFIAVEGRTEEGAWLSVVAPVEQVSFKMLVSKGDKPPREIGFHAEIADPKQS